MIPLAIVDAFAKGPFSGNPAAVCFLDEARSDDWQQSVAAEMNLSETAFITARADGGFDLRWFTPAVEVDLCGHATLASAHRLWESGALAHGAPARFFTRSGELICSHTGEGIAMDFPARPVTLGDPPPGMLEALGVDAVATGNNGMDWLVEVADESAVALCNPDLAWLTQVDARGIIVTARGESCDVVSRFFAPRVGVAEDPVTGSAHCALGPYWATRLGKDELSCCQLSRRGGALTVRVRGARVELVGQAFTVVTGTLQA